MRKISGRFGAVAGITALMGMMLAAAISASAQRFTSLLSFDGTNGFFPSDGLVQGIDGNFYGTTTCGGAYSGCAGNALTCGTVFKITPEGALTTIYSFCPQPDCVDGYFPYGGLVQGIDGNFYGTTPYGGLHGAGSVFKITPSGSLTTVHSFDQTDGTYPFDTLLQVGNGNFYGTTNLGGAYGEGTVFEMTPEGKVTTLYSFCVQTNCTDGSEPKAGLVEGSDGNLYGTTTGGGTGDSNGTVFEITPHGKLTTLHSFCSQAACTDGSYPLAGLVQVGAAFYGTTYYGGTGNECRGTCGTVFRVTAGGDLTTLHSFQNGTDGASPVAGLVLGTDGNLYGSTAETLFQITPGGKLTTIHSLGGTDGLYPDGALVQGTDGTFYGAAAQGGANYTCGDGFQGINGCGTVFSLGVGLSPFVETLPPSGHVGAAVIIMGNNLTGASSVTFGGTAATFTVVSSTEITTTVPTGATTGAVQVVTPSGTLTSNVNFRVEP